MNDRANYFNVETSKHYRCNLPEFIMFGARLKLTDWSDYSKLYSLLSEDLNMTTTV